MTRKQGSFYAQPFTFSLLLLVVCLAATPAVSAQVKVLALDRARAAAAYGNLPLSFEANQGQADPEVKFLSHGPGYTLFLTPTEAVLSLKCRAGKNANGSPLPMAAGSPARARRWAVVRLRLRHANGSPRLSGMDELPGISNYYMGNDPVRWRSNVPTFGKVRYQNVYRGVDLVYYGNHRQLEYDFVLAPGADPRQIELRFDGAKRLRLDRDGNLIVSVAGGELVEHTPVIYQEIDGVRHRVAGGYEFRDGHSVGFRVAHYDRQRSLTIDPGLVYSTYLGGSGTDYGFAIAVDSSGNAYVAGSTSSSNFPLTAAFQTSFAGGSTPFVSKFNSSGSALLYSTYLGGTNGSSDAAYGIAVDSSGNAYITGLTSSSTFPTTAGAFQTTMPGFGQSGFVSKFSPSGSLVYSTYLGGSNGARAWAIAVDSSGNAYVTGLASSAFPTTSGAFQTAASSSTFNAFVAKLDSSGASLLYSTFLGGSSQDQGLAIAVDSSGDAYITGETSSSNFPAAGAYQTTLAGTQNAFVTKLNSTGSALLYSTFLGGCCSDAGNGIAIDSSGSAYITGQTNSNNFPTTAGAFQSHLAGGANAFVSKLSSSGSALAYSTYLGGNNSSQGYAIAVDSSSNAYITGSTSSSDFPTTAGAIQTALNGSGSNAFVSKINSSGSKLLYSTYLGGAGVGGTPEQGRGIALDSSKNVYVTGVTPATNFPTTTGAFQTASAGGADAFVSKLNLTTTCAFGSFGGKLDLAVSTGTFDLTSNFTLGSGCSAINPLTQSVTLQIYTYSVTVPAGSFVLKNGSYVYQGTINGVPLQIKITPGTGGSYALQAQGSGANFSGVSNPVAVTFTIGNESGSMNVIAQIS